MIVLCYSLASPLVKDEAKEGEPPAPKKSKTAEDGDKTSQEEKKSGDETADLQVEFAACLEK